MQPSDLHIGMYLTNTGQQSLVLYDNLDCTGPSAGSIAPGQIIGQIADIQNGVGGTTIVFTGDNIDNLVGIWEKIKETTMNVINPISWLTYLWTNGVHGASQTGLACKFSDLQNCIDDKQVQDQANAIQIAQGNGISLTNTFKQMVREVTNTASDIIPWGLAWKVGAAVGAVYLVTHWKQFFKPKSI